MDSSIPWGKKIVRKKDRNKKQENAEHATASVRLLPNSCMSLISYLKISLASVQQDFVEEFHIFFFHQLVRVDPGALVEPQVNQVHGVTDTLW